MAKQRYRRPGARILWNDELKIKGYIHYTTLGLPQLYQCTRLEYLDTINNKRLNLFFQAEFFYVLWWHSNGLYRCTKDQTVAIINDMGYVLDCEYDSRDIGSTDVMIIGSDFENSDILYFNHDEQIEFFQKIGQIEVRLDEVIRSLSGEA